MQAENLVPASQDDITNQNVKNLIAFICDADLRSTRQTEGSFLLTAREVERLVECQKTVLTGSTGTGNAGQR